MLTPSQLLEDGGGELAPQMFPGKTPADLNTLLQAFLDDGYGRIPTTIVGDAADRAARSWAYARANRNVASRLSRTPASVTLTNEGATTMLGEQIRTFKEAAKAYENDFNEQIANPPTPDDTPTSAAYNGYVF